MFLYVVNVGSDFVQLLFPQGKNRIEENSVNEKLIFVRIVAKGKLVAEFYCCS